MSCFWKVTLFKWTLVKGKEPFFVPPLKELTPYLNFPLADWSTAGKIDINCPRNSSYLTGDDPDHIEVVMYGCYLAGINNSLMMSLMLPPANLTLCSPSAHTYYCLGLHTNTDCMCSSTLTHTHWGTQQHRPPNQPEWLPGLPTLLQRLFISRSQHAVQVIAA